MSARTDLCGGRSAMIVPTATSPNSADTRLSRFLCSGWITGNPHLTLVSVGCCSRARVCLDRRSETQKFVDPAAFVVTNPLGSPKPKLDERFGLFSTTENSTRPESCEKGITSRLLVIRDEFVVTRVPRCRGELTPQESWPA